MVDCNVDNILVSGAQVGRVNGTYSNVGLLSGFSFFTKDNATQYFFIRISLTSLRWEIYATPLFSPSAPQSVLYYSSQSFDSIANIPPCPSDPTIVWSGPYNPVPTVSQVSKVQMRDFKFATATEAGSARFRRLVALGYV